MFNPIGSNAPADIFYFQTGQQHGLLMKQVEIKKARSAPLSFFQEICFIVQRESAFGIAVFYLDLFNSFS